MALQVFPQLHSKTTRPSDHPIPTPKKTACLQGLGHTHMLDTHLAWICSVASSCPRLTHTHTHTYTNRKSAHILFLSHTHTHTQAHKQIHTHTNTRTPP